ncbi:DUF6191 domain-containing protein [Nocardia sp. NPDC019395]|uniref:DUF6191 domain-containing protein n=1 Tax=Nocardia sp. NPDC019395 TaxID=3154686 RepID=UPI0034111A91
MGIVWAMTLPGLVCLLIGLAFAEVLVNRLTGVRLLPWNRGNPARRTRPVAATGFEEVAAVFQGSKHIEFEQRRHSLMHREDESDGAPPLPAYDPAANRVTIRAAAHTEPGGGAATPPAQ